MPWRLPRWACITLPVAVTLKRFLAPDLVFSLGIWLSCCTARNRPVKASGRLKCSLERWKCSGFFRDETTRTASPRQPLISRATKAALMAEPGQIGNVELGNFPFPGLFPRSSEKVQYRCQFQGRCLPAILACAYSDRSSWWSRYSPQFPTRLRPGAGLERACPQLGMTGTGTS